MIYTIKNYEISTSCIEPLIADRNSEWCAVLESYQSVPMTKFQPVGRGVSEQAAIIDLLEQVEWMKANNEVIE